MAIALVNTGGRTTSARHDALVGWRLVDFDGLDEELVGALTILRGICDGGIDDFCKRSSRALINKLQGGQGVASALTANQIGDQANLTR